MALYVILFINLSISHKSPFFSMNQLNIAGTYASRLTSLKINENLL